MGVAGSGKSTVGRTTAQSLGWAFVDADDLHSAAAREQMASGEPLRDDQRDGWIEHVREAIEQHVNVVVACSALRRRHRRRLSTAGAVQMFFLDVPATQLARRLEARYAHFFPESLLSSQLEALEPVQPDEGVVVIDGDRPVVVVAAEIVAVVRRRASGERLDDSY
jgi:carbohydrate kinase (thermoresistant glucokinase family)